jgi:exodeoxyribonuclease VII small subunit
VSGKKNADNSPSVEQAMERLETLVTEMESAQLPLDQLIARYEEGVDLLRLCQEKLDAAQQKIQIITRNATGPAGLEDFSTGADES